MDYDTIYFYGLLPAYVYFVARGIYNGRSENMEGHAIPNQIMSSIETVFWPLTLTYCLSATIGRFLRKEAQK